MPAPLTVAEFVECVKKSDVLEGDRLETYLRDCPEAAAADSTPRQLAEAMIRDGLLTRFQAEQFLQGKWRHFVISGKYKLLERLGSGGMGSVFLCEHLVMRRRVAIKVLPQAQAGDSAALERFHREARAVAKLHHPNIIGAYDIDRDGKMHFLVMEYVEGTNLQDLIKKHGPLDIVRACHYVAQAAQGLQHAHEAGLVHRDIKPANLLLDRSGTIKVLDLGLARFFHDEKDNLTQKYEEAVLGTADYLAPEQATDSHGVDIRADIYSLGVTFYYLLAGNSPFQKGTVVQKLLWHQMRQPQPIRELRPEVSEELAAVLDRMLAKDPAQRYQTPSEVIAALVPWLQSPVPPPAAEEMPQLCPAARGEEDRDGGPNTRMKVMAPLTALHIGPGGQSPVSSLTPFGSSSGSQTPRPQSLFETSSSTGLAQTLSGTPPPVKAPKPRWRPLLLILAGVMAAGAVGAVWWWARGHRGPPPISSPNSAPEDLAGLPRQESASSPTTPHPAGVAPAPVQVAAQAGPARLIVTDTGAPNTFRTLRDALIKARPGDHLMVREETLEEPLWLGGDGPSGKDLVIEGAAPSGEPVIWKIPEDFPTGRALVELTGTQGLRLSGFVLEGEGRVDYLATLSGPCPGLKLSDLQFRGFRRGAIRVANCTGTKERPVRLRGLLTFGGPESEAALVFEANPDQLNRDLAVDDCRLTGPYQEVVRIQGPLAEVDFFHNRLFQAEKGFLFQKVTPSPRLRLALRANTLAHLKQGLHFESVPLAEGDNQLVVQKDLFLQVSKMAVVDGLTFDPKDTLAQWIWYDEPTLPGGTYPAEERFFRKTFDLPAAPVVQANLDITCDDAFTVWVNGTQVGKSPFPYYTKHVYAFDVTKQLHPGRNVLAVKGSNVNELMTGKPTNAGLLVQLTCTAGPTSLTVVSDRTWKASMAESPGWQGADFDDGRWPPAKELGAYSLGHGKRLSNTYQNLPWDSVVCQQFPKEACPLQVLTSGNVRDFGSAEGYPPLEAWPANISPLPTNPLQDDQFLRYPKDSLLILAGNPGVPPVGTP